MWPLFSWCILVLFFSFSCLTTSVFILKKNKKNTCLRFSDDCKWKTTSANYTVPLTFFTICLWCWVMELKRLVIFLVKWHRTRSQWYNTNCMSELLQIRTWPILKHGLRSKLLRLHKTGVYFAIYWSLF